MTPADQILQLLLKKPALGYAVLERLQTITFLGPWDDQPTTSVRQRLGPPAPHPGAGHRMGHAAKGGPVFPAHIHLNSQSKHWDVASGLDHAPGDLISYTDREDAKAAVDEALCALGYALLPTDPARILTPWTQDPLYPDRLHRYTATGTALASIRTHDRGVRWEAIPLHASAPPESPHPASLPPTVVGEETSAPKGPHALPNAQQKADNVLRQYGWTLPG